MFTNLASTRTTSMGMTVNSVPTSKRGFEVISLNQAIKDLGDTISTIEAKLPKRATKMSAGYDIYAPYDFTILPSETLKIPTLLRAYMLEDEVLKIYPRSGLGFKYFTRLANTVGIIDADYFNSSNEGHIWVKVRNEGDKELTIKQGEAFCQGIFQKYLLADGDDFTTGEGRNGGFGSTTK